MSRELSRLVLVPSRTEDARHEQSLEDMENALFRCLVAGVLSALRAADVLGALCESQLLTPDGAAIVYAEVLRSSSGSVNGSGGASSTARPARPGSSGPSTGAAAASRGGESPVGADYPGVQNLCVITSLPRPYPPQLQGLARLHCCACVQGGGGYGPGWVPRSGSGGRLVQN
jgi:hypothetical protein